MIGVMIQAKEVTFPRRDQPCLVEGSKLETTPALFPHPAQDSYLFFFCSSDFYVGKSDTYILSSHDILLFVIYHIQ